MRKNHKIISKRKISIKLTWPFLSFPDAMSWNDFLSCSKTHHSNHLGKIFDFFLSSIIPHFQRVYHISFSRRVYFCKFFIFHKNETTLKCNGVDVKYQFTVFSQTGFYFYFCVSPYFFFLKINLYFFRMDHSFHRINKSCYIVESMSKRFNGLNDTLFMEQSGF